MRGQFKARSCLIRSDQVRYKEQGQVRLGWVRSCTAMEGIIRSGQVRSGQVTYSYIQ